MSSFYLLNNTDHFRYLPIGVQQFQQTLQGKAEVEDGGHVQDKSRGKGVIDLTDRFYDISTGKKEEISFHRAVTLFLSAYQPKTQPEKWLKAGLEYQYANLAIHSCDPITSLYRAQSSFSGIKTLKADAPVASALYQSFFEFCGLPYPAQETAASWEQKTKPKYPEWNARLDTLLDQWNVLISEHIEQLKQKKARPAETIAWIDFIYSLTNLSSMYREEGGVLIRHGEEGEQNAQDVKKAEEQFNELAVNTSKFKDKKKGRAFYNLAHLHLADTALEYHRDWRQAKSHLDRLKTDATVHVGALADLFDHLSKANDKKNPKARESLEAALKAYEVLKKDLESLKTEDELAPYYSAVLERLLAGTRTVFGEAGRALDINPPSPLEAPAKKAPPRPKFPFIEKYSNERESFLNVRSRCGMPYQNVVPNLPMANCS